MKLIRKIFEKSEKHFEKGGKLEKFFPLFEATYTFFYTPGKTTKSAAHVRDAIDYKRIMIVVVVALTPAVLVALYNTGLQANINISKFGEAVAFGWQPDFMLTLGISFDPSSVFSNFFFGALYFVPVYIITVAVGGFWEVIFAVVRKHEIHEGFFVTSLLFPMILPPTIPYWQVAIGISFGVVIGKEVFGGVGMNILNPALTGRAFLFFAYPAQISGDKVWLAVDGISQATPLAQLSSSVIENFPTWWDSFIGFIPGSMGETSALACLIGAVILIFSGIGCWRIMLSIIIGALGMTLLFNAVGSSTNPMFGVGLEWHFVLGGFAFGTVFMATDPVSAAVTNKGKYIYGLLIGFLVIMIRVLNPAYPEGMMLAILFGNVFAPIIDKIFINANIKRRRYGYVKR